MSSNMRCSNQLRRITYFVYLLLQNFADYKWKHTRTRIAHTHSYSKAELQSNTTGGSAQIIVIPLCISIKEVVIAIARQIVLFQRAVIQRFWHGKATEVFDCKWRHTVCWDRDALSNAQTSLIQLAYSHTPLLRSSRQPYLGSWRAQSITHTFAFTYRSSANTFVMCSKGFDTVTYQSHSNWRAPETFADDCGTLRPSDSCRAQCEDWHEHELFTLHKTENKSDGCSGKIPLITLHDACRGAGVEV